MNASISSTCEWPRYRSGKGGAWVACGESALYDGPNGTVHLQMWDSHRARYVSACCWGRAGGVLLEQALAMYGRDWAKRYTRHVSNPEEERKEAIARSRFRWALTETSSYRGSGLKRLDNSGADEVNLPYLPTPSIRRV